MNIFSMQKQITKPDDSSSDGLSDDQESNFNTPNIRSFRKSKKKIPLEN